LYPSKNPPKTLQNLQDYISYFVYSPLIFSHIFLKINFRVTNLFLALNRIFCEYIFLKKNFLGQRKKFFSQKNSKKSPNIRGHFSRRN